VVDRVVAAMERQTRAHRITARGPGYLEVTVDVARIEQVLTNLVGNAMKYSPAGQEIYIDLAQPDMETAEVAVRDHGPGIPAARLAHIFEPYYRATDGGSADGLGLGLYICRNIVLRHGGTIEAVCPEDGGTCVTVRLPIRTP
jgi:signal transduction histidine kinase